MCNDLMCKKLSRSQLSLTHSAKVKTDMPEKAKQKITAGVHGVSPVEELWRKGFVEKVSFERGLEERRSNG